MKQERIGLAAAFVVSLLAYTTALGHANYTGYSGAPTSRGTCASTCHGSGGGTIAVTGFPTTYDPGAAYTVTVSHNGGSAIGNFNASVRNAANNQTAGTIAAGLNTSTYSITQEPNGVHFTSANQNSGSLAWTAPSPGVGDVKLYLAGLQGTSSSGHNTAIVLTATQNGGVSELPGGLPSLPSLTLENRIVRDYLILKVVAPGRTDHEIRIIDHSGRRVATISIPATDAPQTIIWEPVDDSGRRLTPGSYFAALSIASRRSIRKFIVAR
jgi:hypothetical protein